MSDRTCQQWSSGVCCPDLVWALASVSSCRRVSEETENLLWWEIEVQGLLLECPKCDFQETSLALCLVWITKSSPCGRRPCWDFRNRFLYLSVVCYGPATFRISLRSRHSPCPVACASLGVSGLALGGRWDREKGESWMWATKERLLAQVGTQVPMLPKGDF